MKARLAIIMITAAALICSSVLATEATKTQDGASVVAQASPMTVENYKQAEARYKRAVENWDKVKESKDQASLEAAAEELKTAAGILKRAQREMDAGS